MRNFVDQPMRAVDDMLTQSEGDPMLKPLSSRSTGATFAALAITLLVPGFAAAAEPEPQSAPETAAEVDRLIEASLDKSGIKPAAVADDATFLRRVMLDLSGVPPHASDVTLFALDPANEKRADVIRKQLESPEFSENWARYWRDVIFSRATDQRTRRFQRVFEQWMTGQLQENKSWADIATSLLTATGDVAEDGSTALIMVHAGDPKEIAAEVSRIFLGIQIQCANCHDHPTDKWVRKDFHQLAAYFPRIRFQPVRDDNRRSFLVTSLPVGGPGRGNRRGGLKENAERVMANFDRNRDGKLEKSEVGNAPLRNFFDRLLMVGDTNKDGGLSVAEMKALPAPPMRPGQGSEEYFMPDLSDPSSEGTKIEPMFFVSKEVEPEGMGDIVRRSILAGEIVSDDDPWFARAFVNRIWGELVGEGFYMPIDDIGPERTARFPEVLDLLAQQFTAHDYDIRWLYETVALTKTYQRALGPSGELPFAASEPARLRADALYDEFLAAVGQTDSRRFGFPPGRPGGGQAGMGFFRGSPRFQFTQLFEFDPSTPQADLTGTIPQALFFMNSPQVENAIRANGNTRLRQILSRFEKDEDVVRELYLTVLSREPSKQEVNMSRDYLKEVNNRNEAFEDLYWALLNSSEFLNKR